MKKNYYSFLILIFLLYSESGQSSKLNLSQSMPDFCSKNQTKRPFSLDVEKPKVNCNVGDCVPAIKNSKDGVCYAPISLTADATDKVTASDDLIWEYKIDLNNDGKGQYGGYDLKVGALSKKNYQAGQMALFNDNPYADDNKNPFNANGTYPLGVHKICWFVENEFGDVGTCCAIFVIKDCQAPTPYCKSGENRFLLPTSGCILIKAKDLDNGSYDNCTTNDKLEFYFDGDPNKIGILICCNDFIQPRSEYEVILDVELWVEDEEGNRDYCKTGVIIEDRFDICEHGNYVGKISGKIETRNGDIIGPVNVNLYKNANLYRQSTGGPFAFKELIVNQTYTVKPERNDDHLNGVSTQDVTLIQKHILGKALLNSPYQLIAADVNNSKSITSSDISEIRKLILGVIPNFTKVMSWTFVPSLYMFPDTLSPWNASRESTFDLSYMMRTKDASFIGIKLGDVNGTAKAGIIGGVTTRSKEPLSFELEDKVIEENEVYKIAFRSSDFKEITGFQFTLNFDHTALIYQGLEAGKLEMMEDNFGLNRIDQGIIPISWNDIDAKSFSKDEVLFTIVFKVVKSGKLSQMFSMTSDITNAEAYNNLDEILNIHFNFKNSVKDSQNQFELLQNIPNPFNDQTTINFKLNEAGIVAINLYEITGKLVKVYKIDGHKGLNLFIVNRAELNVKGVVFYKLVALDNTATKRMIIED